MVLAMERQPRLLESTDSLLRLCLLRVIIAAGLGPTIETTLHHGPSITGTLDYSPIDSTKSVNGSRTWE